MLDEADLDDELLEAFFQGKVPILCAGSNGRLWVNALPPAVLLPGSFNPVHEGHWELAAAAARLTGLPVAFEMSVTNVDKAALGKDEVLRRLGPFAGRAPVWLTQAPTFAEKAALFPGVLFVLGADTAVRLLSPRYYQDRAERVAAALAQIRMQRCRFLVAGRADATGHFLRLDDLHVPVEFTGLFAEIPETEFRHPLSSTDVRKLSVKDGGSSTPL